MNIPKQIYPNQKPPYWYDLNAGEGVAPQIILVCPNNHHSTLTNSHRIDVNGDVHPSVICRERGCGFHQAITLLSFQRKTGD